jgi:hypothetical protein
MEALMTRGSEVAFSRGMLLVTSAGNSVTLLILILQFLQMVFQY